MGWFGSNEEMWRDILKIGFDCVYLMWFVEAEFINRIGFEVEVSCRYCVPVVTVRRSQNYIMCVFIYGFLKLYYLSMLLARCICGLLLVITQVCVYVLLMH